MRVMVVHGGNSSTEDWKLRRGAKGVMIVQGRVGSNFVDTWEPLDAGIPIQVLKNERHRVGW